MTLETNAVTSKFSKQYQFLDMLIMSYIAVMAIALALTIFVPPLQEPVRHYPHSCLSFWWAHMCYLLQITNVNATLGLNLSNQDLYSPIVFQRLHDWKIVFLSTSPVQQLLIIILCTGIVTVSWYSSINEHITSHAKPGGRWAHLTVVTVWILIHYSFPQYGSRSQERSWRHHHMAIHKQNQPKIITRKKGKIQWRWRWILAPWT